VKRLYPSPERIPENQRSLTDRCRHISELCGLTQRESEVLVLLASGKTVKGVCEELNIAQGTAKHHVSNIYRKIGVFDRQGLHNVVNQGTVGKDSWESVPSRDA
jgi:DNA-binding NarL/FixJ family response regulator